MTAVRVRSRLVTWVLSSSARSRSGQRFDLESERGQRCAEAMGEVGDGFAFDGDDLVDAVGEAVEGGADLGDFGGAGDGARASSITTGQAFRRTGCLFERAGQATGDELGAGDAEQQDE